MDWPAITNLVAIVLSPVIAVWVGVWLQKRQGKRGIQAALFADLFGNRHRPISPENVRSLNMIDAVFADNATVRRLWHEYFDLLGSDGQPSVNRYQKQNQVYREMLVEMAKAVGYKTRLTHLDMERSYSPVGLGQLEERQSAIADEMLRVLRRSEHFGTGRLVGSLAEPKGDVHAVADARLASQTGGVDPPGRT